jgi:hypothetical protein
MGLDAGCVLCLGAGFLLLRTICLVEKSSLSQSKIKNDRHHG